jgi:hypothetical protein
MNWMLFAQLTDRWVMVSAFQVAVACISEEDSVNQAFCRDCGPESTVRETTVATVAPIQDLESLAKELVSNGVTVCILHFGLRRGLKVRATGYRRRSDNRCTLELCSSVSSSFLSHRQLGNSAYFPSSEESVASAADHRAERVKTTSEVRTKGK